MKWSCKFLPTLVDVVAVFEADLLPGLDHRAAQLRLIGGARSQQRPAIAVELVGAAFPVLCPLEVGQHAVPAPAAIAELRPMVEILGLAANIDHAVDRAGAAEHAAARVEDRPAGDPRIGLGLEAPGQHRMVEQFDVAGRDVDQRVAVARPGLEQQHAGGGIFAEPVGQHAASRAGADDDEIRLHALSSLATAFSKAPSPTARCRQRFPLSRGAGEGLVSARSKPLSRNAGEGA
jgi:hypothetical protein